LNSFPCLSLIILYNIIKQTARKILCGQWPYSFFSWITSRTRNTVSLAAYRIIQIPTIKPITHRTVKISRLIGELPINVASVIIMSPTGEYKRQDSAYSNDCTNKTDSS
jgi:hypothetical protein